MVVTTDMGTIWLLVATFGLLLACCTALALWSFLSEYRREP